MTLLTQLFYPARKSARLTLFGFGMALTLWSPAQGILQEALLPEARQHHEALLKEAQHEADQSHYNNAESLYKRALKGCTPEVSPEPDTCKINCLTRLKEIYLATNRLDDARNTLLSLIDLQKNHPDYQRKSAVISITESLGAVLAKQKKYAEAADLYKQALEIRQQSHSLREEGGAKNLSALAYLYKKQGAKKEAKEAQAMADNIRTRLAACKFFDPNRFAPFMTGMQKKIRANWKPPASKVNNTLIAEFFILPDGTLEDIAFIKSGNAQQNHAVTEAIRKASPLETPPIFCEERLTVQFTFDYEIRNKKDKPKPSIPATSH